MTTTLESVNCAVCGRTAEARVPPQRHTAQHNHVTYTLHLCPSCDLQFWSPMKADPSLYSGEGFEAYVDYHSGVRPFPRWAESLFASLPRAAGKALDVGCGDGAVMHRLEGLGYETRGIDLDEKSVGVARKKYGLTEAHAVTLEVYSEECALQNTQFDLITFFEVLEHQDDPLAFLSQISAIAAPGAHIAGSVPNRDRFLAVIDRKLSIGDLPPHHFLWFSSSALRKLLERSGFSNITIQRVGVLSYAQLATKLKSIIDRMTGFRPGLLCVLVSPIIGALAWAGALLPWIGRRLAPSHLFFQCRAE